MKQKARQRTKCEVYSRIVGYLRPITDWNVGKQSEFRNRKMFKINQEEKIIHKS